MGRVNIFRGSLVKYTQSQFSLTGEQGVKPLPHEQGYRKRKVLDLNETGTRELLRWHGGHMPILNFRIDTYQEQTEASNKTVSKQIVKLVAISQFNKDVIRSTLAIKIGGKYFP